MESLLSQMKKKELSDCFAISKYEMMIIDCFFLF